MSPRKIRHKPPKSTKKSSSRKTPSRRKPSSHIGRDFEKLVAVMARLRAPGGCPWDREQTHATLRTYLIEEAYEVLDALDSTDDSKFAEELGDLLLQVLFHAQIAHEEKRFSITDVIREIHDKMVRRHPHVFGTTTAKTAADVLRNWEIIKKEERAAKSAGMAADLQARKGKSAGGTSFAPFAKGGSSLHSGESDAPGAPPSVLEGGSSPRSGVTDDAATKDISILDGVPRTLPALLEALQLTRKAARIGFDWPNLDGIFAKLTEETHELQHAIASVKSRHSERSLRSEKSLLPSGQPRAGGTGARISSPQAGVALETTSTESSSPRSDHVESELGDILFVAVNLARFLHVDPELALKKTSAKFTRRFHRMEQFAHEQHTTLTQIPRDQLEAFWDRAKLHD